MSSFRLLRFFAGLLNVLGWLWVIGLTGIGFVPWALSFIEPIPLAPRWQNLIVYGAPVAGLAIGLIIGLGFFVLAQIIHVLLEQVDLLEALNDPRSFLSDAPESPPTKSQAREADRIDPITSDEKTL